MRRRDEGAVVGNELGGSEEAEDVEEKDGPMLNITSATTDHLTMLHNNI